MRKHFSFLRRGITQKKPLDNLWIEYPLQSCIEGCHRRDTGKRGQISKTICIDIGVRKRRFGRTLLSCKNSSKQ